METLKTRLIVKNIPKHIDERRLRQHFAERGEISDVKIVRTKDGKSRQFAFVGFTGDAQAEDAIKYFHRTFIDTSRIQVERAQPRGDTSIARPWSKYSEGSSRSMKKLDGTKTQSKIKGQGTKDDDSKNAEITSGVGRSQGKDRPSRSAQTVGVRARKDVEKEEFMVAIKKRSDARFWDNDDALPDQDHSHSDDEDDDDNDHNDEGGKSEASSEEGSETRTPDDANCERKPGLVEKAVGRYPVGEVKHKGNEESQNNQNNQNNAEKRVSNVSDMDWLRSKVEDGQSGSFQETAQEDTRGQQEQEHHQEHHHRNEGGEQRPQRPESEINNVPVAYFPSNDRSYHSKHSEHSEQGQNGEEEGLPAGRLFVRNLPYSTTEDDLRELFEGFGMLSEVHLPVDDSHKGKGFAFIQFAIPENAREAMEQLDSHAFRGRLLHIIPARRQPGTPALALGSSRSYKEQKESDRRARAGDSVGWNASYVRADTVVDALADRLGVSKGDILDREEDDMAVRLALGETHLVKENQEYFEKEGVDISALESAKAKGGSKAKGERSDRVILVKNLPYSTESADLAKRFGVFGDLGRVLLPPSRAVALVEFLAPVHARKAFKCLAYTRFQHVPLYLEWAPLKAIRETFKPSSSKPAVLPTTGTSGAQEQAKVNDLDDLNLVDGDGEEVAAGLASNEPLTIYVKNLSFATTEAGLRTCFENSGLRVRSVSIPRKKGKGSSDSVLSMGFGFVEFVDTGSVEKAIKILGGTVVDGHALELKRSTKRLTKISPKGTEVKRSKLIVRNVPFQATAKELRELFSNFGQLKRLRLPKKFDGGHRGFAFVDFLTAQEALNAKTSLEFAHFYGRHLVGEWAEDDEQVDTLRAKVAKDIRSPKGPSRPSKRQKAHESADFEGVNAL